MFADLYDAIVTGRMHPQAFAGLLIIVCMTLLLAGCAVGAVWEHVAERQARTRRTFRGRRTYRAARMR